MATDSGYQYSPLEDVSHIRLMVLQPGEGEEPLSCALQETDINCLPDYEAVSYTWGGQLRTEPLRHEDNVIHITNNLRDALLRLRQPTEPRILWVDSVCINQEDNTEKEYQVGMMGQIYHEAKQVLIWLGEEDEETKLAFDCIQWCFLAIEGTFPLPKSDSELFAALRNLLQRPWFQRCWVYQESTLAKTSTIHCGSHSILSTLLGYVCLNFWENSDLTKPFGRPGDTRTKYLGPHAYGIGMLLVKHELAKQYFGSTLPVLLEKRKGAQATDLRDIIYSLLSVAEDEYGKSVKPDYTRDTSELYTTVTRDLIFGEVGLNMFSCIDPRVAYKVDVPSWVPDWSTGCLGFTGFSSQENRGLYAASGSTVIQSHETPDPRLLVLTGIFIDTVTVVGELSSRAPNREQYVADLNGPWKRLADETFGRDYGPTRELTLLAYLRLCCGDEDMDSVQQNGVSTENGETRRHTREERRWSTFKCHTRMLEILRGNELKSKELNSRIREQTENRRFFITQSGYMGLGPQIVAPGDQVWVLLGAEVPCLLRSGGRPWPTESGRSIMTKTQEHHGLAGECYVHGLMDGEVLQTPSRPRQEVTIM
jgi:hypothetical protein